MPSKGVIYVATGAGYLDLAIQSARSLKQHNPDLPADIFTDAPDAAGLDVFDQVHPVPNTHERARFDCFGLSRFDRTLLLDCDTLVLRPLGDLFDILHRFDLAMAHDVRRASDLIQEGAQVQTPYAFPQLNAGVMLYRHSAETKAFFAEWRRRYYEQGEGRDQVTLKDLLWESDIRFYVLPPEFNLRRVTLLDAWEPLDLEPTIIHSHRLLQHLRNSDEARVTTLQELIELERIALKKEWRDAKAPTDPLDRTEDVLNWFEKAQRRAREGR